MSLFVTFCSDVISLQVRTSTLSLFSSFFSLASHFEHTGILGGNHKHFEHFGKCIMSVKYSQPLLIVDRVYTAKQTRYSKKIICKTSISPFLQSFFESIYSSVKQENLSVQLVK